MSRKNASDLDAELRQVLRDMRYTSLQTRQPRGLMEHHIDAIVKAVVPVMTTRFLCADADGNVWECSKCGLAWQITAGDPDDNEMRYCPKCGRRIDNQAKRRKTDGMD